MAQKSGFFNAVYTDGAYDRTYNANDYSENLAVIISNGVLRSTNDDLKVTSSGMIPSVGVGRAWINGHYYLNDAEYSFSAVSAPVGGTRWDRVMLRFNNNLANRTISLVYVQGTAANTPVKPSPTRTDLIYDLVLADVFVGTNATSLDITDTRPDNDVCGWVYSTSGDDSFFTSLESDYYDWAEGIRNNLATSTITKQYVWTTTLASATATVTFNIPQYDGTGVSYIGVFVNGDLRTLNTHYTLNGSTITFSNTLVAGTMINVVCYKSIDGTGIQSVADEVTSLQNRVSAIESVAEYTYECVNSNDNLSLSQIAQAIYSGSYVTADVTPQADAFLSALGGNTWLAALPTDAQITISVVGKLGVSTPYGGAGTSLSPYRWFSLGVDALNTKKITFDFSACNTMTVWCLTNTYNHIFYGTDLHIKNVNINAKCNAVGCHIQMIKGAYNTGNIEAENCRFYLATTGEARIAENGTFTNCWVHCSSSNTHALCFVPTTDSLIRLIGGTCYAYTATSSASVISAVFYTYGTATNAVIMAYNINCPTKSQTGFYQKKLAVAYAGKTYMNGVCSALTSEGNYYEVVGLISKSKSII